MPSLCTSFASSCLSRLAASCSPRLMSKMAARWVPSSSSGLAIGSDPILHHLRGTFRILTDQRSGRGDLLLKTGTELDRVLRLPGKADFISRELTGTGAGPQPGRRLGQ